MGKPGEAAKEVEESSSESKKNKEVSCIAKFRPWKDWRGEYGFDWVREGPDDYEEEFSVGSTSPFDDLVEEDNPFEYLYQPEFVLSVKYEMSKTKNSGAWSYEIKRKDGVNGYESAHNCRKKFGKDKDKYRMYSYVELESPNGAKKKCSLFSSGDELFYPVYDTLDKVISFFYNGFFFEFIYSSNDFTRFDVKKVQGQTESCANYLHIGNNEKDGNPNVVHNHKYDDLLEECKNSSKELFDEGGLFFYLLNAEKKIVISELSVYLFKYDSLDNINIIIDNVFQKKVNLEKYKITTECGLEIKGEEKYWYGHKVYSWKEALENIFNNYNVYLKNEHGELAKGKDGKPIKHKYVVPVLSIGAFNVHNTIFGFRWVDKWAPHKTPFQPSEGIPIQVNLEWEKKIIGWVGKKPDKICFETDPDVLRVEPNTIKPSKEFTIKLFPNFDEARERIAEVKKKSGEKEKVSYMVKVFAKGENEDGSSEDLGEIDVVLWDEIVVNVWFVMVNKEEFGSDHIEALEEQRQALQNALYQAGIRLDYKYLEIVIKDDDENLLYKLYYSEYAKKKLFEAFYSKYPNNKISRDTKDQIVIFYLPNHLYKNGDYLGGFHLNDSSINIITKLFSLVRRDAYIKAHEMGHLLGLNHVFTEPGSRKNDFCYDINSTSNIMDYSSGFVSEGIIYSFRKYQWDTIREESYTLYKKKKQKEAIRNLKSRVLRLLEPKDF